MVRAEARQMGAGFDMFPWLHVYS